MSNHDESTNEKDAAIMQQTNEKPDREADAIQRLLEEKQRIETELQRLLAAQQTGNTDIDSSHDQMKPAPARKSGSDSSYDQMKPAPARKDSSDSSHDQMKPAPTRKNSTSSANTRPARRAPRPEKKQNVLGDVGNRESEISLDGVTIKEDITEIRFLNTLKSAPQDAADISEAKDGGVLCWTENGVQYIAGEGGVTGGKSCVYLFESYQNVTAIRFDGNFDTSNVTNMSGMFSGCESLTELNLSGWDTSNVTTMESMFNGCSALTALNLSGWNTSNVTTMESMFNSCSSLTSLNLSGWNTSNVTDMSWMFANCESLTKLNLSGWNTSNVTDMSWMFSDCKSLANFNPKWLDTSRTNTTGMYNGISWFTRRKWEK